MPRLWTVAAMVCMNQAERGSAPVSWAINPLVITKRATPKTAATVAQRNRFLASSWSFLPPKGTDPRSGQWAIRPDNLPFEWHPPKIGDLLGAKTTRASWVAKFTRASVTPGCDLRMTSMPRAHPAQFMPPTVKGFPALLPWNYCRRAWKDWDGIPKRLAKRMTEINR